MPLFQPAAWRILIILFLFSRILYTEISSPVYKIQRSGHNRSVLNPLEGGAHHEKQQQREQAAESEQPESAARPEQSEQEIIFLSSQPTKRRQPMAAGASLILAPFLFMCYDTLL